MLLRGAGRPDDPRPSSILLADGRVRAVGGDADAAATADTRRLEADGLVATPGFIDLQVNGAGGDDLTADPDALGRVAEALPAYGVTAFLPTIVTAPYHVHDAARAALTVHLAAGRRGARPLGLHFEGPFLSPERPGVHDPALLRPPDRAATRDWSPTGGVRLATLAPELPGALELIADLVRRGVVVAAGHTAADYDVGRAAVEAGVRYATHLFNAMTPLEHRAPGIAGALLADSRVTIGLIPDGLHVHPAVVGLVWRMTGADRVSAVTDAMAALGRPPGRYRLGDAEVVVDGHAARAGGRLAGSVIGLDAAVRNIMQFAGASLAEAVATVTSVPARLLGLEDRAAITAGSVADLTLLSPGADVMATIVDGRVAHAAEALAGWR
jgi:N-acetylglucosamine-6-phosphate deacetylase